MTKEHPFANANFLSYGSLILGILCLSFSPLFTHWADAPGIVTSFYRMVIAIGVLTPFMIFNYSKNQGEIKKIPLRWFIFPMAAGVFSAFDHAFWGSAIKAANVANATLLNYIAPLWVSLIAILVFRERYKKIYWLGLILVFIGALAVMDFLRGGAAQFVFMGEGFALISSVFYAGYFLLTQKGRGYFAAVQQLWVSLLACGITLGIIVLVLKLPLTGYSQATYLNFILAALISQLLGYYGITYSLGKIPASIVSPSLTLQPVITSVLAIPFANQSLSVGQILGGILVLVGVLLVNRSPHLQHDG